MKLNQLNPNKWQVPDIIAVITLVGGFTLLALGKDGTVGAILATIVGFYFGGQLLKNK